MVVLDSNIIIEHIRQADGQRESILRKLLSKFGKQQLYLSLITVQELYVGESTRNKLKEELMLAVLDDLAVLKYDYSTAKLAGQISRDVSPKPTFPAAAIAATCIQNSFTLATLNRKDFELIPDLRLVSL